MSNVQEFSSMSNFNEFQRAAKAAIRVALQWFFLAIPTVLI